MSEIVRNPEMEKELPANAAAPSSMAMPARETDAPTLLRVGGGGDLLAAIAAAGKRLWPTARIGDCASVSAAAAMTRQNDEVLVLCDPANAELVAARATLDNDGAPRWAVAICGAGDSEDAVARLLTSAMTERELRRENARLRGDLATIGFRVAHDLRTPLGGVLTTAEMLREVLNEDAPKDAPLVKPLIESAELLVELIQRVSLFAKANAGRETVERLNLGGPFWNAFQRLESRIAKAGATLAQPKDWPEAHGHAGWLEIVWLNLLTNALQHGGAGVRMEASWERTGASIACRLRDSGNVPPEKRGTMFFPFERLHEPGAPRGLGLPIARRLVELQGGRCGYAAVDGGGSEFWFTLRDVS